MNDSKSSTNVLYVTIIIVLAIIGLIVWFTFFSGGSDKLSTSGQVESEITIRTLNEGVGETAQDGDRVSIEYTFEYIYADDGLPLTVSVSENEGDSPVYSSDSALHFSNTRADLKTDTVVIGSPSILTGLSEGLAGMKEGETRRVVISPDEGFGDIEFEAEGHVVPPNSTLIYTVTLLTVL